MLKISKMTDYAAVILGYLAKTQPSFVSAKTIATSSELSLPTVSKLLKTLADAGLVKSSRGTDGGYCIAKNTSEITVAEIVTAIEGRVAITECCKSTNCNLEKKCSLKVKWQRINKLILELLDGVKLSDMLAP